MASLRQPLIGRGVELVQTSWLEARNHLDHVALRSAAITTLGADCGTFDDTRLYKTILCILLYLNLLAWHCISHTYDGKSTRGVAYPLYSDRVASNGHVANNDNFSNNVPVD